MQDRLLLLDPFQRFVQRGAPPHGRLAAERADVTLPGRRMKILMLSHVANNPNGGASRIYHMLSDALRARGHEVALYHAEDAGVQGKGVGDLLKIRLVLPRLISAMGEKKNPSDFDVIMSSSGMAAPLFARLRKKGGRRPLLVNHLHGLAVYDDLANRAEDWIGNWSTSTMYRLITGRMQRRWDWQGIATSDLTIVQNRKDLDWVGARMPPGHELCLIPAAIHPELLAASMEQHDTPRDPDQLLWLATWEARKGAAYVPRAFRKLRSVFPSAKLVVAGAKQHADEIVAEFDPADRPNVKVMGRYDPAAQATMLRQSSLFLFPSISEGFGLALPEAMAFGVAAITTNMGFGGDWLSDGKDARVVAPSAEHLGQAMIDLMRDPEGREAMAERGRLLAREFTLERMVENYETEFARRLKV